MRASLLLPLALCLALVGCVAAPPSDSAAPDPAESPETPSASPTPTAEPIGVSGNILLSDDNGYTAEVSYSLSLRQGFVSEIANSAPGLFQAVFASDFSATINNTTNGREIETAGIMATPLAAYPLDQPACHGVDQSDATLDVSSDSYKLGTAGYKIPVIGGYCLIELDTAVIATTSLAPKVLAGGQNETIATSNYGLASNAKIGGLDETSSAAILAQLNAPTAIVMVVASEGYKTSWTATGACNLTLTNVTGIGTRQITVVTSLDYPTACALLGG